jgi:hypothetical protein
MSANRYRPHVVVLAEDDANRQLVNGFSLALSHQSRQMEIPSGFRSGRDRAARPIQGWTRVFDVFFESYIARLSSNSLMNVVLLIDFDGDFQSRWHHFCQRLTDLNVSDDVRSRVFLLGIAVEPEDFKRETGQTFEQIGLALAEECRTGTWELWNHAMLRHNTPERERLAAAVRPILFDS